MRENTGAKSSAGCGDSAAASVVMPLHAKSRARARGRYKVECFPPVRDSLGNIVYAEQRKPWRLRDYAAKIRMRYDAERFGHSAWAALALVLPYVVFVALLATCEALGYNRMQRLPVPDKEHPRWVEYIDNIVVTEGLNIIGDSTLRGGTRYTTWYLGLKGTGTAVAGDTMASHASWSEIVPYSNSVRPTWTPGTMSSGSVDNSGSVAVFTINATSTIYGCFLSSDSTKSGTAGKLYSAGDFASSRAVVSGDTVNVTYTGSYADDGV